MFVDAHAHLTDGKYNGEINEVIARYRNAGVGAVVNAGYDHESSTQAACLSEKYDDMYFTARLFIRETRRRKRLIFFKKESRF